MLYKRTGAEPYGAGYTEPEKSTNAHLSAAATKLVSRCVQVRKKRRRPPAADRAADRAQKNTASSSRAGAA